MPRHIHLEPRLTVKELHGRYRHAADPVERSRWHFLWLLAGGMTATAVAALTGYSAYWIGQIARRYNADGPDGVQDRRHTVCAGRSHLSDAHRAELQPAEHLWPLTNTVLVNRHFASIDDLEDAQAERCVALQGRPDLIRSTTRFPWWPQRIIKRRGPRRNE